MKKFIQNSIALAGLLVSGLSLFDDVSDDVQINNFDNIWIDCLALIQDNSPSLYATLIKNKAILKGNHIKVKLDHKLQENDIKEKKQEKYRREIEKVSRRRLWKRFYAKNLNCPG